MHRDTVRTLLDRKGHRVVTVGAGAPLLHCARRMAAEHVGSLVVTMGGVPIGILTCHDVLHALGGEGVGSATAADYMSTDLVTTHPSADLHELIQLMISRNVRHVPVMERGELVGLVSRIDALWAHMSEVDAQSDELWCQTAGG